ncbi:snake venom 5'-nucleotidase-like [Lycorma delicatula]|uniref:snake venom 5'-nucleotidase-like n=1 Tax=Lycorma delicatula TaxID=130591 RepID=UPI003F50DD40
MAVRIEHFQHMTVLWMAPWLRDLATAGRLKPGQVLVLQSTTREFFKEDSSCEVALGRADYALVIDSVVRDRGVASAISRCITCEFYVSYIMEKINNLFLTAALLFIILHYDANNVLCDLNVLILHNSDMHAHLEKIDLSYEECYDNDNDSDHCFGGFARLKKAVQDIRDDKEGKTNVLFLNAGDTFQGTPYYSIFKWEVIADFIDDLKIDVMSLGNHEFDDSPKGLAPYLKAIKTVSVAANIDITEEPSLNVPTLKPYKILEVGGVQIAIIGYLTPTTQELGLVGNVKFKDEVESIKEQIEHLKPLGIKIFIALGHSGFAEDLEIAEKVPDIDLVIGGHTNTFLYNGDAPSNEIVEGDYPTIVIQPSKREVPVVQAFAFTKYLGHLNLVFDDDGEIIHKSGNPLLLDRSYPEASSKNIKKEKVAKVNKWKVKIQSITEEVIGVTEVYLDARNCKLKECIMGNLITDAYVGYNAQSYVGEGWTDATISFIQGGGIRSSIDASEREGKITYGHLMGVLPFGHKLMKGKISGKYLLDALEFSVHRYEKTGKENVGEFLQTSGKNICDV